MVTNTESIEINTPIWILEQYDGITPLIVRLPNDSDSQDVFEYLEESGFDKFAANCFLKFVLQLQGKPMDGITNFDFEPVLSDTDILMVMFQKDYLRTTKTIVVDISGKGGHKVNDYMKHENSLPVFKNGKIIDKLDVKLLIDDDSFYFAYFGNLEINSHEVGQLKKNIG